MDHKLAPRTAVSAAEAAPAAGPAVTVVPMGGLGNQLFIYGVGRALAHLRGCPLEIDTSLLKNPQIQKEAALTIRRYHLNDFVKPGSVSEIERDDRHRSARLRGCKWLPKAMRSRIFGSRSTEFVERHPKRFSPEVFRLPAGTSLFGYFQSWKYLEPVEADLRGEIHRLKSPSSWFVGQKRRLQETRHAVGVHVRRGDYPDPIDASYYRQAISIAGRLGHIDAVFLFSDDVDGGLSVMKQVGVEVSPIFQPEQSSDIESMLLLSECDTIITANSTFSWWAGWLAEQATTTVIAPRPWHNTHSVSDHDLIPPNWITVGR